MAGDIILGQDIVSVVGQLSVPSRVTAQSGAVGPAVGVAAVVGTSDADPGIAGVSNRNPGLYAQTGAPGPAVGIAAVVGSSDTRTAIAGVSNRAPGLYAQTGAPGPRFFPPLGLGVPEPDDGGAANGGVAAIVGTSDNGTGVFGSSNSAFGVFGQLGEPRVGTDIAAAAVWGASERDAVVGVSDVGRGVVGVSTGMGPDVGVAGVVGTSDNFPGVAGSSSSSYGGVFFSGGLAPLRLIPATTQGAPTTGAHQIGELFVDRDGNLFFCKAGGPPPTWVRIA